MQIVAAVKRLSSQPPTIYAIKRHHLLALALILVVAGTVRFAQPDAISWSKDHSDIAMIAQDIVDGKGIPLVGNPSSAVIPHSPFYVYVLVLPYIFTDNPVIVTMFITTLDLAAVTLLWLIGFRYFGPVTSFVAALAYAVHPWAVAYSRTIWAGDHRVLLFLIALGLGLHGFLEGRRGAQLLCLPIMIIALQVHFAAWALLPVYVLLVWAGRSRISARLLIMSGALGLLAILPFGIGIIQTLSVNTALVTDFQGQVRDLSIRNIVKPLGQAVWLITGLGLEQYSARDIADEMVTYTGMPIVLWVLQGVALLIGVIMIWRRTVLAVAVTVMLWAFLPPIVFMIPLIDVYPHYFMPSIPAYALLVGVGVAAAVDWAGAQKRYARVGQVALYAIVSVVVLTQAVFVLRMRDYLDMNFSPSQFGTGPSIRLMNPVVNTLQAYDDVLVIVQDDWLNWSRYGSWVYAPFLRDTAACLREIKQNEHLAVRPKQPFAVLYAPRISQAPALDSIYRVGEPSVFSLRPEEGEYIIYQLDTIPAWPEARVKSVTPYRFANGVELVGYDLQTDLLMLEWSLPRANQGEYVYTVTFANRQGELLTQQTFPFWAAKNWCAGDKLLTWADVDVPAETTTLVIQLHLPSMSEREEDRESAVIPLGRMPAG